MLRVSHFGIVSLALLAALTACTKSTDSSTTTTTSDSSAASPAASDSSMASTNGASSSDGAKVYQTNCSSCHQPNGKGVAGQFPPLAGNSVVNGDPKQVIHILKYGLNGKIQVAGKTYNGVMPNWSPSLSDGDIASVATYVRSSWGNKASAVTAANVTAVTK